MSLIKVKRKKLLQKAFGTSSLDASNVNMAFRCPSCNDPRKEKLKLVVHLDSGWFHCWTCGLAGKNIAYLFKKFAPGLLQECCEIFETRLANKNIADEEKKEKVRLPLDVSLVIGTKDPDAHAIVSYLRSRGMSTLDICRWRVCFSNEFRFRRKAIFPSFDNEGNLNYYVARAIDDSKYKYQNARTPKSEMIFNELDVNWQQPVVLVEGVFDAVKCPENTIPILGSTLSKRSLLYKMLQRNQTPVIVAFDADAETKAHQVCSLLSKAGCDVYKVTVENDDLGSRDKQDVLGVLQNARRWSADSLITHKISSMKSGSIL